AESPRLRPCATLATGGRRASPRRVPEPRPRGCRTPDIRAGPREAGEQRPPAPRRRAMAPPRGALRYEWLPRLRRRPGWRYSIRTAQPGRPAGASAPPHRDGLRLAGSARSAVDRRSALADCSLGRTLVSLYASIYNALSMKELTI